MVFGKRNLAMGMLLVLAGCQTSSEHAGDILSSAWTDHSNEAKDKLHNAAPLYCYATIGKPDCYKDRQPQLEERLSGYFKPLSTKEPETEVPDPLQDLFDKYAL